MNKKTVAGRVHHVTKADAAIANSMPIPWILRQWESVYREEMLSRAHAAKPVASSTKCPATHAGNSQTA